MMWEFMALRASSDRYRFIESADREFSPRECATLTAVNNAELTRPKWQVGYDFGRRFNRLQRVKIRRRKDILEVVLAGYEGCDGRGRHKIFGKIN